MAAGGLPALPFLAFFLDSWGGSGGGTWGGGWWWWEEEGLRLL